MKYDNPELNDALAAEYVLGTLIGTARRRFEVLLQARPALRRQVRDWEYRLNRMASAAKPVAPPPQSWQQLEQRLFAQPARQTSGLSGLAFWKGLSAAGLALSLMLGLALFYQLQQPELDRLAMLTGAEAEPVWMIKTADKLDRLYVTNIKPMPIPQGKTCLLWLRPEGSEQYYAVGVLPDQGEESLLMLDQKMAANMAGELIVTLEERNETMPATPSGPALFQGKWLSLAQR